MYFFYYRSILVYNGDIVQCTAMSKLKILYTVYSPHSIQFIKRNEFRWSGWSDLVDSLARSIPASDRSVCKLEKSKFFARNPQIFRFLNLFWNCFGISIFLLGSTNFEISPGWNDGGPWQINDVHFQIPFSAEYRFHHYCIYTETCPTPQVCWTNVQINSFVQLSLVHLLPTLVFESISVS